MATMRITQTGSAVQSWARQRITAVGMAVLCASFLMLADQPLMAQEAYCVVVSVDKNAWVVKADTAVKSSLHVGDLLFPGDKLEVFHGNAVDIAFDQDSTNTLHVEGHSAFEISDIRPTNVNLNKGKIYALLDNPRADRRFQITTPTAIAAVRGTQFMVNTGNAGTEVITYKGSVKVVGLDTSGKPMSDSVILEANQKTDIRQLGQAPTPAKTINTSELKEFTDIKSVTENVRKWLQAGKGGEGSLPQASDAKSEAIQKTIRELKHKPLDQEDKGSGDTKDGERKGRIIF